MLALTEAISVTAAVRPVWEWVSAHWFYSFALFVASYVILEQLLFQWKRKSLPGPTFVVPIIGSIVQMVLSPTKFWHHHFNTPGLSWNSLLGKFMVITSDAATSRKIFEKCSDDLPMILHPNAYKLLAANNMAFMNGPTHKALRHQLVPLFTQKALGVYLNIQEKAIREHMAKWFTHSSEDRRSAAPAGIAMKQRVFDLNTNTSLSVFIGPYLDAPTRKVFQHDYKTLTDGFLAFPLDVPGTDLNKAKHARTSIIANLTKIAVRAKERMGRGDEPSCLLDFWMQGTVKEIEDAKSQGKPMPEHSTDHEIACIVLDFLFASQDASTSSLTYTIHYLCEEPNVLARVRAEQAALRAEEDKAAHDRQVASSKEPEAAAAMQPRPMIDLDTLAKMTFTNHVMKEVLRVRPPATIVPHIAAVDYELSPTYKAPKGTLIVPSIWASNRVGYTSPESFDPDRYSPERAEDKKFPMSFLTFGAGPHYCLGQRYAMNHIMLFIALMTSEADFVRKQTPNMHEIIYAPTIYPADGCVLTSFTPRGAAKA